MSSWLYLKNEDKKNEERSKEEICGVHLPNEDNVLTSVLIRDMY